MKRVFVQNPFASGRGCLNSFIIILCLLAQPAFAADKWISIKSKNFQVLGNGSDADLRRVSRHLEELRGTFATLFPKLQQGPTVHTIVFVFRNDDSFRPYRPADVTGYFQQGEDLNFMAISGHLNSHGVVLHDYIHSLFKDAAGTMPVWLAEGLAEHYSTLEMGGRDNEFTIGKTPPRHVRTLNENQFIPLERLLTLDHTATELNEKTKQGIFYAEVSALIHYLSTDPKRQPQLLRFLNLLSQDRSLGESFNEAFQLDIPTLDKELRDYLRGKTSLTALRVAPRDTGLIDRTIETKTLSEAQAQFYLGDLLLHTGHYREAEAHFNAALTIDPRMASANASQAMAKLRQRQSVDAIPFLKKALDADQSNYLIHYYAAYLMQSMAENGEPVETSNDSTPYETMRAHLRKAIDLAPYFAEAYGLLAHINLTEGENLKEADEVLRKALAFAPGRHDLSIKLAEAMLRTEQVPAARGLLGNLGRNSADPAVRSRAANIIEQLDMRDSYFKELGNDAPPSRESTPQPAVAPVSAPRPASPEQSNRRDQPKLEALTPLEPQVEGEKVQGLLILLDCNQGLSMRIQIEGRVIELHSSTPDRIQFLSYTSDVADSIKCGPRNPGTPVRITYRNVLGGTPTSIGEPLVVEFMERK